jgi:hypothetical protein
MRESKINRYKSLVFFWYSTLRNCNSERLKQLDARTILEQDSMDGESQKKLREK